MTVTDVTMIKNLLWVIYVLQLNLLPLFIPILVGKLLNI